MSCSLISLVSPTLKQPEATATFGFETGHTSRQSEDGGITRRFVVNQTLQGPRVFIRSKATCAAPLCEVLTPCRGLRPHHVQKDRIGTWEVSGLTGTALRERLRNAYGQFLTIRRVETFDEQN
jgi:hypothetical protein